MEEADKELLVELRAESLEHTDRIEPMLLEMEQDIDSTEKFINDLFRAVHSIKGGFGFFGITNIVELTHSMENLMSKLRDQVLQADTHIVSVLIKGIDKLRLMLEDIDNVSDYDISSELAELKPILEGGYTPSKAAVTKAPSAKPKALQVSEGTKASAKVETEQDTLRVKIGLLNSLMDSGGELVLNRNQLLQSFLKTRGDFVDKEKLRSLHRVSRQRIQTYITQNQVLQGLNLDEFKLYVKEEMEWLKHEMNRELDKPLNTHKALNAIIQNLDRNTAALQENIMNTRMQPIATLFNKFPRIVRDLSKALDKEVDLETKGQTVELDKSILEKLADPMTHLLRNSMDHGIEVPDSRESKGKARRGKVVLDAFHEAGKVVIVIQDDGAGINESKVLNSALTKGLVTEKEAEALTQEEVFALVFRPGFSTADVVSDVSGRGVGMDVVKTNIESIGGTIEVESEKDVGSKFIMRLPLTLAILPALVIKSHDMTFCIPQLSLEELVNIKGDEIPQKISRIQNDEVLRLRDELLPLKRLSDIMNTQPMYHDKSTDSWKEDRRARWSDRREARSLVGEDHREGSDDRRVSMNNSVTIVILNIGERKFGLVVDEVVENEEVVIKPVSRFFNNHKCYAGCTILGNGDVAMILDASGLLEMTNIDFSRLTNETLKARLEKEQNSLKESQEFLTFDNGTEDTFALTLDLVGRVETVKPNQIQKVADKEFVNYEDRSIQVLRLEDHVKITKPDTDPEDYTLIIPKLVKNPVGILCHNVIDTVRTSGELNKENINDPAVLGTFLNDNKIVMILDIYNILEKYDPEKMPHEKESNVLMGKNCLLAEDTQFFQRVIYKFLTNLGLNVDVADDGEKAWDKLVSGKKYDLVVTDIQMPHLDGFGLVTRIRKNADLKHLPVMALSSMATEKYKARGYEVGVSAYEIKLDKEKQKIALEKLLKGAN